MPNENSDALLQTLYKRAMADGSQASMVSPKSHNASREFMSQLFGTPDQPPPPLPASLQRLNREYVYADRHTTPWVSNKDNPGVIGPRDYEDDPQSDMALLLARRQYPYTTNRVGGFSVGRSDLGKIGGLTIGGLTSPSMAGPAIVSLLHTGALSKTMPLLMHELGHVRGLEDDAAWAHTDPKFYGTYDVADVANQLHKDILLPNESKRK